MTREEAIFAEVLGKGSGTERDAYLDAACAGDPSLRRAVGALVLAHEGAAGILESPPVDLDATSDVAPALHGVGWTIGPYKLLEQIGGGGMGVVYMAEQVRPVRRKVALKIIKPGMDSGQVIARFEAERQALTMMDHPNIAKVLDAGTTDAGRPYFVMELVKGVPITDYCDQARLNPRQRLDLFVQVCNAVQHAHQKGVIHRDLKPGNVLVTLHDDKPVPKVIDFGIAKAAGQSLTDRTLFTNYAQMLGTPLYMSPEQAQISGLDVDTRSDVYSLGVLLYELLTGTTPFDKQRLCEAAYDEMRRIIREEEPPKPSTRLSSMDDRIASVSAQRHTEPKKLSRLVHGELDWIVMKSLEKDRARRYDTANGLARDVERYLHDETVQACPPSAGYRFRKFARRNRASLLTASLLSLVLLVGSVISTWLALRARRAESLAQARLVAETDARQQALIQAAKATAVSGLLQEALESADPERTNKGIEYTVRQLLDDLSQRLGNQLADQPEADAAIRATIGNAYHNLGRLDEAESHLRTALDLRRRALGPDHPDVAQSLLDHAFNVFARGDRAAAETEARQALAVFRRANVKDERVLRAYGQLGMYLMHRGRDDDARVNADEAFVFARAAGITEHRLLAKILHDLVPATTRTGDLAGAEELARRAVAMHGRVSGASHPETAWARLHLAQVLERREKFEEAEASWREALRVFRGRYDDVHDGINMSLQGLERVLVARNDTSGLAAFRRDQASRLLNTIERDANNLKARMQFGDVMCDLSDLEGALAAYALVREAAQEKPLPELRSALAERYARLARLFAGQQKQAQAEAAFRQAISFREPLVNAPPRVRLAQAVDYNELALTIKAPHRIADAEGAIRKAIELKQALVDEHSDDRDYRFHLAHSYVGLGAILGSAGRGPESAAAAARAAELIGALGQEVPATPESRMLVAQTLWQRADAAMGVGRLEEAEQLNQQSMTAYRDLAADFPNNPFYRQEQAFTHRRLAIVADRARRTDDAIRHLSDALGTYRKLVEEFPATASYPGEAAYTVRALAIAYVRDRRYADAESLLLPELADLSPDAAAWQAEHFSVVAGQVLGLYRDWGKPAAVDEWCAKVLTLVDGVVLQSPKNVELRLLRGRLLETSGEYRQAVAEYTALIDMAPGSAAAWGGRGYSHFHLGEPERAITDFTQAIDLNPELHGAWLHRGLAHVSLGQWDKAAADFDTIVERWPADQDARFQRAAVNAQRRRPDDAIADLRQAVALGFRDAERLENDDRLEPLRTRDDFKKLLADLPAQK